MKKLFIFVGILFLFVFSVVVLSPSKKKILEPKPTPIVCTQEAKICPDGSAVGRSGPQCEFALCPTTSVKDIKDTNNTQVEEGTFTVLEKKILTNGVYITPLEVIEDSRCPTDINCMWVGTVRVTVKLEIGTSSQISELSFSNSVIFLGKKISLVSIFPNRISTTTIPLSSYRFEFKVTGTTTVTPTSNGTPIR